MKIFFWLLVILVVVQTLILLVSAGSTPSKEKSQPLECCKSCQKKYYRKISASGSVNEASTSVKDTPKKWTKRPTCCTSHGKKYDKMIASNPPTVSASATDTAGEPSVDPLLRTDSILTRFDSSLSELAQTMPNTPELNRFGSAVSKLSRTLSGTVQSASTPPETPHESTGSEQPLPMFKHFVPTSSRLDRTDTLDTQYDSVGSGSFRSKPTSPRSPQLILSEMTQAVSDLTEALSKTDLLDKSRSLTTSPETSRSICKNERSPTHNTEKASPTSPMLKHSVPTSPRLDRTETLDTQYDSVLGESDKSEPTSPMRTLPESEQLLPMLKHSVPTSPRLDRTETLDTQYDSVLGDPVGSGSDKSEPTSPRSPRLILSEMTQTVTDITEALSKAGTSRSGTTSPEPNPSESTGSEQPLSLPLPLLQYFVPTSSRLGRTESVDTQYGSARGDPVGSGSDESEPTSPRSPRTILSGTTSPETSRSNCENERSPTHEEHNTEKASTCELDEHICEDCEHKKRHAMKTENEIEIELDE